MPVDVEYIKRIYPEGTKIKLIEMADDPLPVPSGTIGTVVSVDDIGSIHVQWENGSNLAVIPGVDSFSKL